MAGRILPIALATVSGVAIAISTFDRELKEQRRKRLEEEYSQDVTAVSALNSEGPSPMASSAIKPPPAPPTETGATDPSRLSSMLGMWAWKKPNNAVATKKEANQAREPREDAKSVEQTQSPPR